MKRSLLALAILSQPLTAEKPPIAGADENTPSQAHYFSWIDNTNEGTTTAQTEANMAFFQWLKDEYGMRLDIYAFDAGAIDAPNYYGKTETRKFKSQFPDGFAPLAEKAKGFGGRLGVWLGPDGFGDTRQEEDARIELLTSLCRDHNFHLFKMDAVCGQLRDEKQDAFIRLMESCRKHSPDLILLNHRLNLGKAEPHATTFLWEGAETYIDVHMVNNKTATHNRAQAISRGLPPELKRLSEDHGVCLSSCLDYWQDDLILQAFNRSMILAPQLYGSPWFLRDDEFPQLARIFNLHRRYRHILTKGIVLPEESYGPNAVSRGDGKTRLITLRNLTWEPVTHDIDLDESIGLESEGGREVRLLHPYEEILGKDLPVGAPIGITIHPFRSVLVLVTTEGCDEPSLDGGPYRVVRNVDGQDIEIDRLTPIALRQPWHRKLGDLEKTGLPADWVGFYEATCYAADNNALEMRSLERSGPTAIPAVKNARDAFLGQALIKTRALSDQFMFDGDPTTVFDFMGVGKDRRIEAGCLRIDLGSPQEFDVFRISTQAPDRTLIWNAENGAEFSEDLVTWVPSEEMIQDGPALNAYPPAGKWRYFRMRQAPDRIAEVEAFKAGLPLSRDGWRGSNLFAHPAAVPAVAAWSAKVKADEITPTSYLCVAVEGKHGKEGCYAALRMDGKLIGAPDRAVSYPINPWEYPTRSPETGYTYYFPLDESMVGKELEVVLLGMKGGGTDLQPSVWITARDLPFTVERVKIPR
ncbi:hypothetical protein HZ994_05345 [Akkermansiaceae bacterium]|nr:hypothetical protein HZ994_05345 [Akkermansiaceae bacterium]